MVFVLFVVHLIESKLEWMNVIEINRTEEMVVLFEELMKEKLK